MAERYGSYVPGTPDPVIQARLARKLPGLADVARAEISEGQQQIGNQLPQSFDPAKDYGVNKDIGLDVIAPQVARSSAPKEAPPAIKDSLEQFEAKSGPPSARMLDDAKAILARGSYSEPDWGSDYSIGQVARDEAARAGISDRYRAGVERNNAEAEARGNPMDQAIEARKQTLAYESLMPAYSGVDEHGRPVPYEPSLKLNGVEQRQDFAPTWPLRGDVASIERANAMMKPQDRIAADQAQQRAVSLEKLKRAAEAARARGLSEPQVAETLAPLIDLEAKKGALGAGDYKALADLLHPRVDPLAAGNAGS